MNKIINMLGGFWYYYRGWMKGFDINLLGFFLDKLKIEFVIYVNLEIFKRVSVVLFFVIFLYYL